MGKGVKGKGCPSTNNAERALLEGYRMGIAQSYSRASPGAWGNGQGDKGGGKGRGNGKAAGGGTDKVDRTCQRSGCHAAEKGKATFGGGCNCFACGLSLTATLPVEQLVEWAYQARLEAKKGKDSPPPPAAKAPTPKAKAAATTEELATLRVQRLAEMKDVNSPPKDTPMQEVARVFVEEARAPKKLELDWGEFAAAKELSTSAVAIVEALKAETMPSEDLLKPPAELVEAMIAKSAHSKSDAGKTQADAALQTTKECLATMRAGGTDDKDELFVLMAAREKRLEKEAQRLEDKQPSKKSRKLHLVSMTTDYAKALGAQADSRATGAAKATERAAARIKAADQLIAAATRLKQQAAEAHAKLSAAHQQRSQLKEAQGKEVVLLLEEKLKEVEAEEEPDVVFDDAIEFPDTTNTEDERDEAQRFATLLQQQLLTLQTATTIANATIAQQAAELQRPASVGAAAAAEPQPTVAQLWHDLSLDFPAEVAQLPAHDNIDAELKAAAAKLHTLLSVVPWGSSLPAVQFMHLDIQPCQVHGLVGDAIWQACWTDRHAAITAQHAVPYKLLNIAKTVAQNLTLTTTDAQKAEATDRYAAVVKDATNRRKAGGPY